MNIQGPKQIRGYPPEQAPRGKSRSRDPRLNRHPVTKNRSGDTRLNGYPLILYTACRSLTLRQSSRFFSCAFPLPALQSRRVRCQFLPHAVPYRTYLPSGDSYALPALPVHSSPISPLPVSLFRSPSVSSHQGHSAFLSPKRMSVSSPVSTDYSKVPVSVSVPAYSTNSRSCLPKRLHSGFCLPNCCYLQKHWQTCWHSHLRKRLCLSSLMHSGLHWSMPMHSDLRWSKHLHCWMLMHSDLRWSKHLHCWMRMCSHLHLPMHLRYSKHLRSGLRWSMLMCSGLRWSMPMHSRLQRSRRLHYSKHLRSGLRWSMPTHSHLQRSMHLHC